MSKIHEDVSTVFEKLTVKEIQEYERKTRAEIEKRKEDLRVMVGERYRDLIEAADTIRDMKMSVEKVLTHVGNMCDFNHSVSQRKRILQPMKHNQHVDSPLANCYSIAAQIKLFLAIPDKIWTTLENGDLLKSATLYLLAQHIRTNLEIEVQHNARSLSTKFPVVARQWASIIHFRASILNHCQVKMKSLGCDDQEMAECLCAILYITDNSLRKLCSDFLLSRMTALEDILSPSHQTSSVKDQVISVILLIKETLCMTCTIFHEGYGNLLMEVLESTRSLKENDMLKMMVPHGAPWTKYLPSSLTGFRPAIQTISNGVSAEFLQETCSHWIRVAKDTITSGVTQMLSYIKSVKGLSVIQEAIVETLLKIKDDNKWLSSCKLLLQKDIDIWEEFLSPLFVFRIKAVVRTQLQATLTSTQQSILSAYNDIKIERSSHFERDIADFIWTEEPGDLPSKFTWGSSTIKDENMGNLTMKSKGFTPRVQSICLHLDNRLKSILEDVGYYIRSSANFSQKLLINTTLDLTHIQSDLQSAYCELVNSLIDYINTLKDSSSESTMLNIAVSKALLLSRICAGLAELCPHLRKAILKDSNFGTSTYERPAQKGGVEDSLWNTVYKSLSDEKLALYRFWKSSLWENRKSEIKDLIPVGLMDTLKHIPQWDLIEIEEEDEKGETVKSTISVPMQPSWQMESLLYNICWEIHKIGGHIMPRCLLNEIQEELLNHIVTTYEDYLKNIREENKTIPQKSSLQHLFNIRFVSGLVTLRDNQEPATRIQTICDDFESFVDPFDLDVFSPYINNHLKRCVQRSLVLLGPLTSADRIGSFGSNRQYLAQKDQHNVLNLSTGCRTRFTLLPFGSSSNRSFSGKDTIDNATTKLNPTKPKSVGTKVDKSRSVSPERSLISQSSGLAKSASSSFFGAMSSSWFRN